MTEEQKQLLLIDLCARLPYGVKVQCYRYPCPVTVLYAGNINEVKFAETGGIEHIDSIKPYLRPMSSMTEEEEKEYELLANRCIVTSIGFVYLESQTLIDWLNSHHFDYRGLIPMGLALEVKEGMYKTNKI